MSVVPKFVSNRAKKEYRRGYSPELLLKTACAFTLAGSIAAAGDVKQGTIDWLGKVGGYTANVLEIGSTVVATGAEIVWEGGGQAIKSFDREFDGELPTIPNLDVTLTDSAPQQAQNEAGYIIQPDDYYWKRLGALGMSDAEIAECDARVSLSNQPVLIAEQTFVNPC